MWWLMACSPTEAPTPRAEPPPSPVALPSPAGPPGELSGAALQDPTGFPRFHDHPAPAGPRPDEGPRWSALTRLSADEGGLRPQVAAGPDGTLHLVYYAQTPGGDLLRHRISPVQGACDADRSCAWSAWSEPEPFGSTEGRNWGPDLVVRPDGSAVVSWDHTLPARSDEGQVLVSTWRAGAWSEPEQVNTGAGAEVGSAHVADARGEDLAVVWIERQLSPGARFQAMSRWRRGERWEEVQPLAGPAGGDPNRESWHTNVERRPDGSVLAGWDLGPGGGENQVVAAIGQDGRWEPTQDLSAGRAWGERPHFAFTARGEPWVLWFHRVLDRPLAIWARDPGGALSALGEGLGGFQFDPEIAINDAGVLCAVWGWDSGAEADLVYSLRRDGAWSRPARVSGMHGRKPGLPSLAVGPDGSFHVAWAWWLRGQSEVWYARLGP